MPRTTVIFLVCLLLGLPASAQDDFAGKLQRAQRLLELTGAAKMGEQFGALVVTQMVSVLKTAKPDIPSRALEIVKDETTKLLAQNITSQNGLLFQIATLYSQYFSDDEVRTMIAFYETPIGRKLVASQPLLFQESVKIGNAWGQSLSGELGRRIRTALEAESIKLDLPGF